MKKEGVGNLKILICVMKTLQVYLRYGFDRLDRVCLKMGCTGHEDSRDKSYKGNGNFGSPIATFPVKHKACERMVQFYFRSYRVPCCGQEVFESSKSLIEEFSKLDMKKVCTEVWKNRDLYIGDIKSYKKGILKKQAMFIVFEVLFNSDLDKFRASLKPTMLDYKILDSIIKR